MHPRGLIRGLVIEPEQVKSPVDNVESQLCIEFMSASPRFPVCSIHRDHNLPLDRVARNCRTAGLGVPKIERQHVGRTLMVKVSLVELGDSVVVNPKLR